MEMKDKCIGFHVLVDFHGCNSEILKHTNEISETMYQAAKISGATVVGRHFKQFEPYGVSGVIIIAESHLSIHTWPEFGFASVDFFSCSDSIDINAAIAYLKKALNAQAEEKIEISRGSMKLLTMHNQPVRQEPVNELVI